MSTHRFMLQKYQGPGSRLVCLHCNDPKRSFVPYIDTETMLPVHCTVGRCNRESKCGYHYSPKQYFEDNNLPPEPIAVKRNIILKPKPVSTISRDILIGSMKIYEANNFVHFLASRFGKDVTREALGRYFIGTSKHWPGATVFWQVDKLFRVRTGKIMLYNPVTGRRVKEPHDCITWVHSALKLAGFEMKQCLFGEHLLADSTNVVAVVESEKTAIIASNYFPELTWVATGGLSNISFEKMKVLSGRRVILFPDVKGYQKWDKRMNELSRLMPDTQFSISDLIERNATEQERQTGCDIADYLLRSDLLLYDRKKQPDEKNEKSESQKTTLFFPDNVEEGLLSSEPWPDFHLATEKKSEEIKSKYEPFHLLPSMKDQSCLVDVLDF
jgi:hypothetical protein